MSLDRWIAAVSKDTLCSWLSFSCFRLISQFSFYCLVVLVCVVFHLSLVNGWDVVCLLLARQFTIETTQCNCKRLQGTQWVSKIHRKHIFWRTTELHYNIFRIRIVDQLKVFHRRLCDTTMEIQHIRLRIVVPHGRFIVQFHHIVHILYTNEKKHERFYGVQNRVYCMVLYLRFPTI